MNTLHTAQRTYATSAALIERAERVIPRGINSHGRNRTNKIVFARSAGAHLWDVDGNRYVDTVMGLGPILFGHNEAAINDAVVDQMSRLDLMAGESELEAVVAERIVSWVPCAEQVLFSVSGSEAVQAAVRIARATTGRRLILKFDGHYHGWMDPVFTNANGVVPGDEAAVRYALQPNSGGQHVTDEMLAVTRFNDLAAFDALMREVGSQVAAVIMEPVPFNFGAFLPERSYLEHVRDETHRHGALLIFDEVVSGFRLGKGGAQELLGVTPDLATFAKAMANGFPISMIAGSRAAMASAMTGTVRHAGTYNAAPLALAAANATMDLIEADDFAVYDTLDQLGGLLQTGLEAAAQRHGVPLRVNRVGSVAQLLWDVSGDGASYRSCHTSDQATVAAVAERMADYGSYSAPRGLVFVGARHTREDVETVVDAFDRAVAGL